MADSLDARIEKSRRALLATGIKLLLNRPNASLSEIADQAGVGRTTLYRQFSSREQLIQSIARRCLDELDQATAQIEPQARSYREAIEMVFHLVMPLSDRLRFLAAFWEIAEQDKNIVERNDHYIKEMSELIDGAKQEGSIDSSYPTSWITDLIDSFLYSAWKLVDINGYRSQQAAEMVTNILFNGIGSKTPGN
jgi:AcrR family transcriptional regulator